ncbi:MAG: hypothetical protein HY923_05645 [Elusimicrobia bacterium]|nr:hypothetical protein [Elusimicrobiota bacterium]
MKRLAALAAPLLLGACAFGRLKPGMTKEGAAVPAAGPSLDAARRDAVTGSLELFLAPGSAESARMAGALGAKAGELTGRARWKRGAGVIEVKFGKVLAALDQEGLLRPKGFPAHEPRVLLLVSEPLGLLGIGTAGDTVRRGLYARGITAIDGRDNMNNFQAKGSEPAALAAGAARLGADWLLRGAASSSVERVPLSGAWRAHATLLADAYTVSDAAPVAQSRSEANTLDVSSAAARGKALEHVGEEAAGKAASAITESLGGRSQGAVFVSGAHDAARLKALLAAVRGVEGVAGAYLANWRGEEETVVLRVFLAGLRIDGLAARLLRADSTLTLLSVEPDDGRLAVEIPRRGE